MDVRFTAEPHTLTDGRQPVTNEGRAVHGRHPDPLICHSPLCGAVGMGHPPSETADWFPLFQLTPEAFSICREQRQQVALGADGRDGGHEERNTHSFWGTQRTGHGNRRITFSAVLPKNSSSSRPPLPPLPYPPITIRSTLSFRALSAISWKGAPTAT